MATGQVLLQKQLIFSTTTTFNGHIYNFGTNGYLDNIGNIFVIFAFHQSSIVQQLQIIYGVVVKLFQHPATIIICRALNVAPKVCVKVKLKVHV